ncbi:vitellogenin-2-like [Antennarius striatus]|uniref:vitellogenin-2-like n=1 Tax=Antennarius striatus TaxID=241820 RepID=UPI0035AEA8B1
MRVLVLALAVALTAGYQFNLAPEFAIGKSYVYKYEAYLSGGLPEEGLARAGVKIQSKVFMSAVAVDTLMLKLVDPEIFEYSGIWPKDAFIPATKLTSALLAQLTTPIKFEYTNGVVGRMYAPAGVSETVMNIYRGLLNIFQLKIKKTQNVYELQEPGVQGTCKTHYVISEDTKADRILLTKTKDLNQCQEPIIKDVGLAYLQTCPECLANGKALKGASAIKYTMKPAATGALILEASSSELIQFSPFNIINGAAQMEAKQLLTFLEIQSHTVQPIKADYLPRGSLQYEFATELLQTPIQLLRIRNAEAQIIEVLNHLVTFNEVKVHDDAPLKFIELVQLLREVRYESIQTLWTQYGQRPDYRHWILSALPAVGNHVTLRFIKEKYLSDELNEADATLALIASVHMVTADLEAIRIVESLISNRKVQERTIPREVVMLGYGTLVYKYCVENPTCPSELLRPILDITLNAVAQADHDRLVIALKVLGNAGHPGTLKTIMKLLPNFGTAAASLPKIVHINAVLAMRNIAKKEPKLVQDVAIQIFLDKTLSSELRMVAAMVLFETKLPMGLVTVLADTVLKDSNLHVGSFVYTYMKAMTKNTSPDLASVAAACNVAVKLLSPKFERLSSRYSRTFYLDVYQNPWLMGAAASAFYINDAATLMPKAVLAKARTYLAGAYADVLEVGVRTEGIQETLLKIPALPENADRITKMREAMKALSQWRADPKSKPLASLSVKFFGQEVGFVNVDKAVVDDMIELFSEQQIQKDKRELLKLLQSGFAMHYVKPLLLAEVRRILPTAVGLPMELSFYTSAVAATSLEFHAKVTPPLQQNFHLSQLLNSDISLRAAVSPSLAVHTFAVMGVNTALLQATVVSRGKVYTIVPAKIEANLDRIKGNFKLHLVPVENIDKIASVLVDTYAVARNVEDLPAVKLTPMIPATWPSKPIIESSLFSGLASSLAGDMSTSSEIIRNDLPNQDPRTPKIPKAYERKVCALLESFGVKACTMIQSRNALFIRDSPLYAIVGNHVVWVEVSRVSDPVIEKIEIEIQVGKEAAQKIVKIINQSGEELLEDGNVLMKLKKILVPGPKNRTASISSSSSESEQSLSSSILSSGSSSRRKSKMIDGVSSSISSSSSLSRDSSSSSVLSKEVYEMQFTKNHAHQHSIITNQGNGRSSASSFESIYNKDKFLANVVDPTVTILIRPVRADQKVDGYQIAAYYDKVNYRVQLIIANLVPNNHWRMCADGVMLSQHKLMAKVDWGLECKQYQTEITAETGRVGKDNALRMKLKWDKLPSDMKRYAEQVSDYMSKVAVELGVNLAKANNPQKEIKLSVAITSDTRVNFELKTPRRTWSKFGMKLPISLPFGDTAAEIETMQDSWTDKIIYMVTKAHAAECILKNDKVITFNNRKFRNEIPNSCYQVLAQDCSPELKFIVLLRKDQGQDNNQINVKIADIDVDLLIRNNNILVNINGVEIPLANLPYQHPTAQIQIRRRGDGIALHAPSHGLQEIMFDINALKVKIVDWMRGQTCGLCGKADGEIRQEFLTPNKRIVDNAVSFAHSWVLSGKSCRDASECFMNLQSVKLEQQLIFHGQESKCFSVEPVLRCLSGCVPVRTTAVTVGYHCVPADSNLNSDGLSSILEKSIDLRETAEAHLSCSCTAQCS